MSVQQPNLEQAIQNFNAVLASDNDSHQQAEWYKALALLKMEKVEEAKAILTRIVAAKNYQYDEAESILKLNLR
jgi:tetratricopeptide (TPR) repeat protein